MSIQKWRNCQLRPLPVWFCHALNTENTTENQAAYKFMSIIDLKNNILPDIK